MSLSFAVSISLDPVYLPLSRILALKYLKVLIRIEKEMKKKHFFKQPSRCFMIFELDSTWFCDTFNHWSCLSVAAGSPNDGLRCRLARSGDSREPPPGHRLVHFGAMAGMNSCTYSTQMYSTCCWFCVYYKDFTKVCDWHKCAASMVKPYLCHFHVNLWGNIYSQHLTSHTSCRTVGTGPAICGDKINLSHGMHRGPHFNRNPSACVMVGEWELIRARNGLKIYEWVRVESSTVTNLYT